MRDVVADIDRWLAAGKPVALATVVETWGSGPRRPGARMAMTEAAEIAGSVSGGCVESAVVEAGLEVLGGRPSRLLEFGVADETAWNVGLACGGTLRVFVQALDGGVYRPLRKALADEQTVAWMTVVGGPAEWLGKSVVVVEEGATFGEWGGGLDAEGPELARRAFAERLVGRVGVAGGAAEVFVDVLLPSPRLVLVGGVHIAMALTSLAKTLGYWTAIVDPRQVFGSEARFPHVDRLIQEWPGEAFSRIDVTRSTAVATLSHDPKIDDPALTLALRSPAFYVGALGSRKTHERRRRRLLQAGLDEEQVARVRSPIGLDLGASTPEEIALAIMAEVVAAWHQR